MEKWLTVKEVAELLDITERTVHWNAAKGKYGEVRYDASPKGGFQGKLLKINLAALPPEAQVTYFRQHPAADPALQVKQADDGWDGAAEWKRVIAGKRLQILRDMELFISANPGRGKTELINIFVKTLDNHDERVSVTTLYNWQKAYRTYGRCGLLPDWGKRERKREIDPEAWEFFLAAYGNTRKRTVANCYSDLLVMAKENGWRIPSLRTLQRMVQEDIDMATLVLAREGEEAFRNKCAPYLQRDPDSIKGNQIWVGDHYRFDFFCKGTNGKPVRPWLTAWQDMRSRKLVGWVISFSPCTNTIMAAFANGALNKEIGLPKELYMDNGRDYTTNEFAGRGFRKKKPDDEKADEMKVRPLVEVLDIIPHFAIPGNARAKTIERFFEIVADQFCRRIETYCGSDNKERPEGLEAILKNSALVPTLDEIKELFDGWVQHIYHKTDSEGNGRKGECPDETFARTRDTIRLANESALKLCLMRHSKALTVGRNGVKLFGNQYHNIVISDHLGEKVYVRYRDEDLSKVFVFTLKEEFICEAALLGLVDAVNVDKEVIKAQKSIEKAMKLRAKAGIPEAKMDSVDTLKLAIEQSKKENEAQPVPNVIEPVRVNPEFVAAAKEMEEAQQRQEKLAVGGMPLYYSNKQNIIKEDRADRAFEKLRSLKFGKE